VNGDSDPDDDHGHGTHVAGTIGAVGNDGLGVTGVSQSVSLAACKFLDGGGWGFTSGAIACLDWVASLRDRGVRVVATNNSWGGGGYSQALVDAIAAQEARGVLFVAAAGNDDADNDRFPHYPSSYDEPNVIAVAATTADDGRAWFSNIGRGSVDVGAPGLDILSTLPGGEYGLKSGTSMATPHVTGLAALLAAADPGLDWRAIRNGILSSGDDVPELARTVTGKRINAHRALTCTDATVRRRVAPAVDEVPGQLGQPLRLEVLHIRCTHPAGPVSILVAPEGIEVPLVDDGSDSDSAAGDGLYAGIWTPEVAGPHVLLFPDGDAVSVAVPDGSGYTQSPVPFAWRAVSGASLDVGDDETAEVALPFPVWLGGATYDTLRVSDNGLLSFDGTVSSYSNEPLPVGYPATVVAPFWDDLVATRGTPSNVFVGVGGIGPHRELVVEWRDLAPYVPCDTGSRVRFQVVFFEDRPDVLFNYADVAANSPCDLARGGSATVGLQIDPQRATLHSVDEPSLDNGTAILWEPDHTPGCVTDAYCDDGIACTADSCVAGACAHTAEDDMCPREGACMVGLCDPTVGCSSVPDPGCAQCQVDSDCDDAVACTVDRCTGASCEHTPRDGACDDGDVCTMDRCDVEDGCEYFEGPCPPPSCAVVNGPGAPVVVDTRKGGRRFRARFVTSRAAYRVGRPVTIRLRSATGEVLFTQVLKGLRTRGRTTAYRGDGAGVRIFRAKLIAGGRQRFVVRGWYTPEAALTSAVREATLELDFGGSGCIAGAFTRTIFKPGA
jgi:hypothetical protein